MHYAESHKVFRSWWFKWSAALVFWTLCGVFFGVQTYLINLHVFGQELPWTKAIPWSLSYWYTWAILAPLVLWLANRFQLEQQSLTGSLAVHIPSSVALAVIHLTLLIIANQIVRVVSGTPFTFSEKFKSLFAMHFHWNVLTYWLIVAFRQTLTYYQKYRERELRASQVEAELARAELQALRMQLHPHFLFNTLNSISALMYTDVEGADSMLTRLSDLLRSSMRDSNAHEVCLKEELEFIDKYLEIEKFRFAERLTVRKAISPDTLEALVPHLVLQPLVENAIRHGIASQTAPGLIEIGASRENGSLFLQVRDNGRTAQEPLKEGIGLSNTRERLKHLYGATQSFTLQRDKAGGMVASVVIPYHLSQT